MADNEMDEDTECLAYCGCFSFLACCFIIIIIHAHIKKATIAEDPGNTTSPPFLDNGNNSTLFPGFF